MKKILFSGFLLIFLFSCDKIDKFTQFTVQTKSIFEIPAGTPVHDLVEADAQFLNLNEEIFREFNTSTELIDKATIKEIKLNAVAPPDATFNFLTDVEVYFETDNLPRIRVAWLNNIQNDDKQTIKLEHLTDNLSEYLKDDHLKISAVFLTDEVLVQPVQIEVDASFLIEAEIIGK